MTRYGIELTCFPLKIRFRFSFWWTRRDVEDRFRWRWSRFCFFDPILRPSTKKRNIVFLVFLCCFYHVWRRRRQSVWIQRSKMMEMGSDRSVVVGVTSIGVETMLFFVCFWSRSVFFWKTSCLVLSCFVLFDERRFFCSFGWKEFSTTWWRSSKNKR